MSAQTETNVFNEKMSLYIPRVDLRSFKNILCPAQAQEHSASMEDPIKLFIAKQFKYQRIGEVERVDLLSKKTPDGWDFYIAFIHFDKWYDTPAAQALQKAVIDPNQKAKLQFHERWYWIVNENKKPLDANTVELHETIRALHENQQEHLAIIKNLEEQVEKLKSAPPVVNCWACVKEEMFAFEGLTLETTPPQEEDDKEKPEELSTDDDNDDEMADGKWESVDIRSLFPKSSALQDDVAFFDLPPPSDLSLFPKPTPLKRAIAEQLPTSDDREAKIARGETNN